MSGSADALTVERLRELRRTELSMARITASQDTVESDHHSDLALLCEAVIAGETWLRQEWGRGAVLFFGNGFGLYRVVAASPLDPAFGSPTLAALLAGARQEGKDG